MFPKKVENFIIQIEAKLDTDIRNTMNGHDFIEIFFLYVNKIKNTQGLRLEIFERAFLLSLQPDFLGTYKLFETIEKIYA